MRTSCLCLFSFLLFFTACNNKATSPSIFNHGNLESSFISIAADSAYTLRTGKGAVIKIAANTFAVNKGEKVNIEIKEAFNMQDILLAGLATQSNGRALRSGGMIYFNASSQGRELEFNKEINVSIPSEIYDPAMQLFKGEITGDSSINWVDPQPLDTTPNAQMILLGERLFSHACKSCHKVFWDFTGPSMAGFSNRMPNRQWIYDFIASPAKMIAKDPYAAALFEKWKPTVMTAFPALTKYEIDAILAYSENEQRLYPDSAFYEEPGMDSAGPTNTTTDVNPCGTDTVFYPSELAEIVATSPVIEMPDTITPAEDMEILREGFTDPILTKDMYDFNIKTNGWYNVDAFVEGLKGTEEVVINAEIINPYSAGMTLYLFCPDKKLLSVGVQSETNKFKFNKINGNIPLYINDKAILLAFGSNKSQLYYGIKEFRIKQSQDIKITLLPTIEDELKSMIKKNSIEGVEINTYEKEFEIIQKPCDGDSSKWITASEKPFP